LGVQYDLGLQKLSFHFFSLEHERSLPCPGVIFYPAVSTAIFAYPAPATERIQFQLKMT
jgi:hypothetical protein